MENFSATEMLDFYWEFRGAIRDVGNEIKNVFRQWGKTDELREKKEIFGSGAGISKAEIALSVVQEQEKSEEDINDLERKNRFFFKYYEKTLECIRQEVFPDFLKIGGLRSKIGYANFNMALSEEVKEFEKQYAELDEKQKKIEMIQMFRCLAICYARRANIFNRGKDFINSNFKGRMSIKQDSIVKFLKYAIMHNELVRDEEKIVFGIRRDEYGRPVLDAALPGLTRFSVHMGARIQQTWDTLKSVNAQLKQVGIEGKIPMSGNYVDLEETSKMYTFGLPIYTYETGIINSGISEENKKYLEQISKLSERKNGLAIFSNFIYSDFNDREIFHLAELAKFMKGKLYKTRDVLKQRDERRRAEKQGTTDLSKLYLIEVLEKCNTDIERAKVIREIYDCYEIAELSNQKEKTSILKSYLSILSDCNIDTSLFDMQTIFNNAKDLKDFEFLVILANEKRPFPILDGEGFELIFKNVDFDSQMQLLCTVMRDRDNKTSSEFRQSEQYLKRRNIFIRPIIRTIRGTYDDDISKELISIIELVNELSDIELDVDKKENIKKIWSLYCTTRNKLGLGEQSDTSMKTFKNMLGIVVQEPSILEGISEFEEQHSEMYESLKEVAKQVGIADRTNIESMENSGKGNKII